MKRFIFIITVVCIASLTIFLFTGCPTAPGYYIKFKVDGVEKNYGKGLSDFGGDACGNYTSADGLLTEMVASPEASSLASAPPDEYFLIVFPGQESFEDAYFSYGDGVGGFYSAYGNAVTITSYGDEGGVIEGTFSGTVSFTLEDKVITEGKFRVMRVDDDSFNLYGGDG